jgi:D-lactate dehydrogenase (cytochrome)
VKAALPRLEEVFGQRLVTAQAIREQHGHGESWHPAALPDAVLFAETEGDLCLALAICNETRTPVIAFGGGTSVEGQVQAAEGGISIDLSRMNKVVEVRPQDMDCTIEPGVTRPQLNDHIRDTGLFFPVDPAGEATLGGMAATRASGTNAVRYGTMKDMVLSLRAVLPGGKVVKTGQRARKSSAGYDLTRLFIGSEGTLGIISSLNLKLVGRPERMSAAVCSFASLRLAVEAVVEILQAGIVLSRIELADAVQMRAINLYSKTGFAEQPTLFFEFSGNDVSVNYDIERVKTVVEGHGAAGFRFAQTDEDRAKLWHARAMAVYASKLLRPGTKGLSTDVCVPVSNLTACIEETERDVIQSGMIAPLIGHVGDGNFHLYILFDPANASEVAQVEWINSRLAARAIAMDGTCTGEHGVGLGKRKFLEAELGSDTVALMRTLKSAIDPLNIMNPGKMLP